jgi:putative transposon-encoded protein
MFVTLAYTFCFVSYPKKRIGIRAYV